MGFGLFQPNPVAPLVDVAASLPVNVVGKDVPLPSVFKVAASGRMDVAPFDHRHPSVVAPDGNETSKGKAAPETRHHDKYGQDLHTGLPAGWFTPFTHG